MQKLSINTIKGWTDYSSFKIPNSISCHCPFCGSKVTFSLVNHNHDAHRSSCSSTAKCPHCDKSVHFFIMKPWNKSSTNKEHAPEGIYMYPAISTFRNPKDYKHYVSESLQKTYESALDSYNSKNYIATAVGCRRTLEGIFYFLLDEEDRKKNLHNSIEIAKKKIDWVAPLNSLAHMIRQGGNLGAHFDEEREPDENMAKSMIELLEYLMEYLYELPKKIKDLQRNLEISNSKEDENN